MKQSRKSAPAPELAALRAELRDAQSELALAYRQFDQATAPELVEACIYRISAAKARCDYYLRVLKAQEPEVNSIVRLCDSYNIPIATNLATAELLIKALERGDLEWRNI